MSSVKRGNDGERREQTVSSVAIRERETTPAPASAVALRGPTPSSRPTTVPAFDPQALAASAALRHEAPMLLPVDASVPLRTGIAPPLGLTLRLSFVLAHIDERSTIAEIAAIAQLSFDEVRQAFVELAALGLVRFTDRAAAGV